MDVSTSFATGSQVHYSIASPSILEQNIWYFVAMTYDGNNVTFYIDGVFDSEFPRTGNVRTNNNPLAIGRHGGDTNQQGHELIFNGIIDDIRIYNRALSANEISKLFNQPVANAGPNQIVCNEICNGAVLDGRKSYDPNGEIVSYNWVLKHRENSSYDITANGETPAILDLETGIYDITLTITDDDNLTDTDEMILKVIETCNPCTITKGDLDSDGDVDGDDLSIFSQNFGTIPLAP